MKFEWVDHGLLLGGAKCGTVLRMADRQWRWLNHISGQKGFVPTLAEAKAACEASVKQSIIELAKETLSNTFLLLITGDQKNERRSKNEDPRRNPC